MICLSCNKKDPEDTYCCGKCMECTKNNPSSSNGRTGDFESSNGGSNPSEGTKELKYLTELAEQVALRTSPRMDSQGKLYGYARELMNFVRQIKKIQL